MNDKDAFRNGDTIPYAVPEYLTMEEAIRDILKMGFREAEVGVTGTTSAVLKHLGFNKLYDSLEDLWENSGKDFTRLQKENPDRYVTWDSTIIVLRNGQNVVVEIRIAASGDEARPAVCHVSFPENCMATAEEREILRAKILRIMKPFCG